MLKLLVVLQIFQPNTSVEMVYKQVSNKYIQVTFKGMVKEIIFSRNNLLEMIWNKFWLRPWERLTVM